MRAVRFPRELIWIYRLGVRWAFKDPLCLIPHEIHALGEMNSFESTRIKSDFGLITGQEIA